MSITLQALQKSMVFVKKACVAQIFDVGLKLAHRCHCQSQIWFVLIAVLLSNCKFSSVSNQVRVIHYPALVYHSIVIYHKSNKAHAGSVLCPDGSHHLHWRCWKGRLCQCLDLRILCELYRWTVSGHIIGLLNSPTNYCYRKVAHLYPSCKPTILWDRWSAQWCICLP